MWQELKSYLLNLEEGSYDLVVTLSKENEELKRNPFIKSKQQNYPL